MRAVKTGLFEKQSLKQFIMFACSSFTAWAIDMVLVLTIRAATSWITPGISLLISVLTARAVSSFVNFLVNRFIVFRAKEKAGVSALKFYLVTGASVSLNYLFLYILTIVLSLPLSIMKIVVDLSLFFGSFMAQKYFVFRKKKNADDECEKQEDA